MWENVPSLTRFVLADDDAAQTGQPGPDLYEAWIAQAKNTPLDYSPEVENVLYQHPEVVEVAVVGAPDPKWGEAVIAVVVKQAGSRLTEQGLIDFARGKLAG